MACRSFDTLGRIRAWRADERGPDLVASLGAAGRLGPAGSGQTARALIARALRGERLKNGKALAGHDPRRHIALARALKRAARPPGQAG